MIDSIWLEPASLAGSMLTHATMPGEAWVADGPAGSKAGNSVMVATPKRRERPVCSDWRNDIMANTLEQATGCAGKAGYGHEREGSAYGCGGEPSPRLRAMAWGARRSCRCAV